ncbi:MAG: SoxR reducing system RseC family protein [Methylotenera sp.]|jgi:sigma-E factor negative regulatory protein RseC
MIEQHAIILSTQNDSLGDEIATIEVVRKTACGLCGKTRGCGNAIWGKIFAHNNTSFKARNIINARVGQHVIVGIDENALMKSALLLYIVPLVTMLIGTILMSQLYESDIAQMLGAFLGLIIGFFWVKGHTAGQLYYQKHQPKVLRLDIVGQEVDTVKFQ